MTQVEGKWNNSVLAGLGHWLTLAEINCTDMKWAKLVWYVLYSINLHSTDMQLQRKIKNVLLGG